MVSSNWSPKARLERHASKNYRRLAHSLASISPRQAEHFARRAHLVLDRRDIDERLKALITLGQIRHQIGDLRRARLAYLSALDLIGGGHGNAELSSFLVRSLGELSIDCGVG